MKDCSIDGCGNWAATRGWCPMHYQRWQRHGDPLYMAPPEDGSGVCTCPTSHPNPKCCRRCGFPCVHRMAPHIRDLAIAKMPQLARQIVTHWSQHVETWATGRGVA